MMIHTKKLIATSLAMLLTAPAFAGASLDTLLGGGSLTSNDGKLVFSDFKFTPVSNAPAASDIEILTLDSGLLFGTPTFTKSVTGIIDFGIDYKVSGVGAQIVSVDMISQGTVTGDGEILVDKVVTTTDDLLLAELTSSISSSGSSAGNKLQITPQNAVDVSDGFYSAAPSIVASAISTEQNFATADTQAVATRVDPSSAPSPTAALAGMLLLGAMGVRRRRG